MSLSERSRIARPEEEDAPSADVLRPVKPKAYSGASGKVSTTFDSESEAEGFEFVRLLPGVDVLLRLLAHQSWKHGVSPLAGTAMGEVMQTSGEAPPAFRPSIFKRRAIAQKLQR